MMLHNLFLCLRFYIVIELESFEETPLAFINIVTKKFNMDLNIAS